MLQWTIGDVKVTRVPEMEVAFPVTALLTDIDHAGLAEAPWLDPYFADGGRESLRMSIHALVVDTPSKRIIVDTCYGNDKSRSFYGDRMQTGFLRDLEALGFARASFDLVLCTHMHVDHLGWNTMLEDGRWVPTFPNARYLFGRLEMDHALAGPHINDQDLALADSVQPLLEAGLVDLVETDHRINAEVSLFHTPGHTPGHVSVAIESQGQRALITGDMVHHPCQFLHPMQATPLDADLPLGAETRAAQFARWADNDVLVIGTHFAAPTAGRVVREEKVYRLDPG